MTRRSAWWLGLAAGAAILSGCAHLEPRSLPPEMLKTRVEGFQSRLAGRYEILSSVVFKFKFMTLASLSMASIDLTQARLSVAGISPLGITLFKVASVQGRITDSFIAPELAKHGDVAKAVTENIREIYFDLTPRAYVFAAADAERWSVRTAAHNGEQYEYVFSERDGTLLEKRLLKNGGEFWRIEYGDWIADAGGFLYPRRVRFAHIAYGYELLIMNKEERPF